MVVDRGDRRRARGPGHRSSRARPGRVARPVACRLSGRIAGRDRRRRRRPASPAASPVGSPAAPAGSPAASLAAPAEPPADSPAPPGPVEPAAGETPPEAGPVTEYPNYGGEVVCPTSEGPGSFNGAEYAGQIKTISATDDQTVVFELCAPDPAFQAKVAFAAYPINDTDYLLNHVADGSIIEQPNGTGPYRLGEWRRGDQIIFEANESFWGEPAKAATAVLRWSSEPGQKFIELQSGAVDGIDNVQPDDVEAISGDAEPAAHPARGLQRLLRRAEQHPPALQQREGAPGHRAWASTARRSSTSSIPRAPRRPAISSRAAPSSAAKARRWYEFDLEAAQALLAEGLAEEGMETLDVSISYRVVDRAYLPLPDQVALAIADQLVNNLGINATTEEIESTTFIDNTNAGPRGHLPAGLERRLSPTSPTSSTSISEPGAGAAVRRDLR